MYNGPNESIVKKALSFTLRSVYFIAGTRKKIPTDTTRPISLVRAINAKETLNIKRLVLAGFS